MKATGSAQRGNTLVGFILGLVVGLLVALVVAVYVTKVPIPFMNKGLTRNAEQDAAEEKKNKDWDPNAPLYGKSPANNAPADNAKPSKPSCKPQRVWLSCEPIWPNNSSCCSPCKGTSICCWPSASSRFYASNMQPLAVP